VEALGVRVPWKGSDQDLVALRDITWRRNAEEDLRFKNALLTAQQETSPNAILIVDEKGRILNYNQRFIDLWKIRPGVIAAGIDEPVLQSVLEQIADPDAFLARVRYLYTHPEERSFEEISLRDGRVLERFSSPVLGSDGRHYGRVWYFREIKEHR
jgi:PAS domain-containing protein